MTRWRTPADAEVVAHRVAIAGQVIDARTGRPLAGVRVLASGPVARETTSRVDGVFWFEDLPEGEYAVDTRGDEVPRGPGLRARARAGEAGARPAWVGLLAGEGFDPNGG